MVSEDILAHINIDVTLFEIHNLAYFYHWGREECWNSPITERRVFNNMIKQQLKAESGKDSNRGTHSTKPKYKES